MAKEVAVIFTAKSVATLLAEGGTSSWRLDRNNARRCTHAVCTRNAHADWVEGPEAHHAAFMVGKVSDVVPSPTRPERYLIQFSEYALIDPNIPDVWKGDRNPVRYADTLEELGIEETKLKWKKMPEAKEREEHGTSQYSGGVQPLTISDAKKGLALTFGVSPDAVEITIRG
jgi:hypothetical protein